MDRQQTLAKAVEYHQAGDVESAKSMYKALLNASLDHNNLCYMLGLAECQTGQVKSGLVRLADTMRLYPDAVPVREQFRNFLRAALGEAPAPSHFGSLSSVVEDLWPVVASPDGQGGAVAL